MQKDKLLDGHFIKKRFNGRWLGATYFGFGVCIFLILAVFGYGIEILFRKDYTTFGNFWQLPFTLGTLAFLFCNLIGAIMSLTYLISGIDKKEKLAGLISLLLNLSPYLVALGAYCCYSIYTA